MSLCGAATAVGFALILSTVTTELFSYNGYDAAINFSEGTQSEVRQTGQAVTAAVLMSVLFQVVPLVAIILAPQTSTGSSARRRPSPASSSR